MTSGPDEDQARTAALLIRVWSEPGSPSTLRARLLDGGRAGDADSWAIAVGDTAIGQEVLRWLQHVRDGGAAAVPVAEPGPGRDVPPLLGTGWLADHLGDPGLAVVEVGSGPATGEPSHLPGSARLDWFGDLQQPDRRTFVDAAGFAAAMDALGISTGTHVVLCAGAEPALAASAYWCFAYHGHRRLSLLDGGRARWAAEGRPLAAAPADRSPATGYRPGPGRRDILVTRDQLLAGLVGAPPGTALVDCRTREEFVGRPERPYDLPVDRHRMVGRIPGARSLPVEELLDPAGRLRPEPVLRSLGERIGIGPDDHVVVYCGVTDRSALVWFVLHELLGWPDVACYYGAWSEYGSLADVPVEQGG